jgi:dTDP-glucose pyrophosphorylase
MIISKNIKKFVANKESTIIDIMKAIQNNRKGFILIIDEKKRLLSILTDGDIRRLIIKKINLTNKIKFYLKRKFYYLYKNQKLKNNNNFKQIPIVDKKMHLLGIFFNVDNNLDTSRTAVFILAGGLGKRMKNLTLKTPKPMLIVNKKPILENIILSFKTRGFFDFTISTNYLSKKIKSYFKNGSKFGVVIKYVKERKFLGTAGSLSLLPKNKYDNIFITNGDVYSKVNFKNILNEHLLKNNDITICAKVHELQLPYGVLNNKIGGDFVNEKPKINYLVNAGIYIIKNKLLNNVKKNKYLDMNIFINMLKSNKKKLGIHVINENIFDIGNKKQYLDIKQKFKNYFL